jgi:hypothetical protein
MYLFVEGDSQYSTFLLVPRFKSWKTGSVGFAETTAVKWGIREPASMLRGDSVVVEFTHDPLSLLPLVFLRQATPVQTIGLEPYPKHSR